jgi:hypothetical protein
MFDLESIISKIRDIYKTNINTYITAINSEKGDTLADTIPTDNARFIYGGMQRDPSNYNIFMNFGFKEVEAPYNGNEYQFNCKLDLEICFRDTLKSTTYKKCLRYTRAILDCLERIELEVPEIASLSIDSVYPANISVIGDSLLVSGVTINF